MQWLHFFSHCGREQNVPEFITEKNIKTSYNIMYSIFQNPELQARYENSLARSKEIADDYMRIGEKKGILIGEKRGEKKGILIGKKRGEIEGEIGKVKSLLKYNISLEKIKGEIKYLKYIHIKTMHAKRDGWDKLNSASIFEALQKESPIIIE